MTTTTTKPEPTTAKPKPTTAPSRRRKPARKSATPPASKRKRVSSEQSTLAAMANAKAKPAARISGANIAAVQRKLRGQKPSEVLGVSPAMLAKLASGTKTKADLKPEPRGKFLALGSALGSTTFYGRKLAGMLWAIERGFGTGS